MAVPNLKKAFIVPLTGKSAGQNIPVLFNPTEYSIEKSNQFQMNALPGLANPVAQFVNGNADTLTMELLFNTYNNNGDGKTEDVRNYTGKIAQLLEIDSATHAPPICRFVWGEGNGHLSFQAVIERLTQKFTMFLDDGTPVRATLNVTFKEYKTVGEQLKELNLESADHTKRVIFKDGDSLWFFAAQEYKDPGAWRFIAEKNDIDNPRTVASGRELIIPNLD
jgi:nucleoid-associated protein YgaU